ncbi:unnamed protein product [Candida verbasci]|uniref:C2H2-type domain-containing protein n=1 Tax=Candida verbasci TaxID=1227364 RepID=A0A9W4TZN8_9ASCO|nr:unnamed protein product [Candida verbasci]
MELIEAQRAALEELDLIEYNIAQRLSRFPYLLNGQSDSKITNKLKLLQQHELKFFINHYNQTLKSLQDCINKESSIFNLEFDSLQDKDNDYTQFDKLIMKIPIENEINSNLSALYQPYSSNKDITKYKIGKKNGSEKTLVKRKYLLSSISSHLYSELDDEFEYLDLKPFYDRYVSITKREMSFIEYLYNFYDNSQFEIENKVNYLNYLKDLSEYLVERLKVLQPLKNTKEVLKSFQTNYSGSNTNGQQNEKGEVFCKACNKWFTKSSVYQGHLQGKKHMKNLQDQNSKPEYYESLISCLTKELKTNIEFTISHYEKSKNQSEREKALEIESQKAIEEEFTSIEDDSDSEEVYESDDDDDNFKHLPLGNDGTPIPFWLYKLQGLNKVYNCEVCGNMNYRGMKNFEMHFNLPKHQNGLKLLGVKDEYIHLFKNISEIEEVEGLWSKISKDNKTKKFKQESIVEVEDKDGNVMSEKDYIDLKKQGLI